MTVVLIAITPIPPYVVVYLGDVLILVSRVIVYFHVKSGDMT